MPEKKRRRKTKFESRVGVPHTHAQARAEAVAKMDELLANAQSSTYHEKQLSAFERAAGDRFNQYRSVLGVKTDPVEARKALAELVEIVRGLRDMRHKNFTDIDLSKYEKFLKKN